MTHEIDLIPASYRERLKIQRGCHIFFVALILIIVLTVFLRFLISNKNKTLQSTISTLQRDKSFNLQKQHHYNELLATERRLRKNLEILDGLRGGPPVRQILKAIDRVLNGKVWFLQWTFKRAGEITEAQPQTLDTGYFIIIPKENSQNGRQQAWKLDTHMTIKGQALDHSSFSNFVQKLLNQPEIDDVKVLNTQQRSYLDSHIIDFNIIVIVNNQQRDQRV